MEQNNNDQQSIMFETNPFVIKKMSFRTFAIVFISAMSIIFSYLGLFDFTRYLAGNLYIRLYYYIGFGTAACLGIVFIRGRSIYLTTMCCLPLLLITFLSAYFIFQNDILNEVYIYFLEAVMGSINGMLFASGVLCFLFVLNKTQQMFAGLIFILLTLFCYFLQLPALYDDTIWSMLIIPTSIIVVMMILFVFVDRPALQDFRTPNHFFKLPIALFLIVGLNFLIFNETVFSAIKDGITALGTYYEFSDLHFYYGFFAALIIASFLIFVLKKSYGYIGIFWITIGWLTYQLLNIWQNSNYNANLLTIISICMGTTSALGILFLITLGGRAFLEWGNRGSVIILTVLGTATLISCQIIQTAFDDFDLASMIIFGQSAFCAISLLMIFSVSIYWSRNRKKLDNIEKNIEARETETIDPKTVLSAKELLVFEQLIQGYTLRQISGELHMKYDTVNFHYKNIYRKLNVNSKIELIVLYRQTK